MSSRAYILAVVGVLALSASHVRAFEETKGGAVQPAAPQSGAAPEATLPGLDLRGTGTSIGKAPPGVEVTIPGLGKLGVLPKLDFGLELLYGVNDQPAADQRLRTEDGSDDLRIRGSLKHRF